jgi:NhaP-type Na+/H+ or K+/H+ antiporter
MDLVFWFGLIAVILLVSALVSGLIDRAPLSFPMIFLLLGFALGGGGMGLITIDAHSPVLGVVATLSLALVLFLDAVKVQFDELRSDWRIPMLSLGPGTLLTILAIALTSYLLLNIAPLPALLLGAILASTDPVILRDVLRDNRIPRSVRRALGVEAGMNDIVVLPIVLILIAVLTAEMGGWEEWLVFLAQLLLLSPLIGLAVGGFGAWLMNRVDAKLGIRREYQALYGIGLVLAAFAAAQALQGDGFLAAFFAGLAVSIFNVSLCDCFLEFGETTAEMAMLLAFVLFGAVFSTLLWTVPLVPVLILAVLALGVIRPAAMWLVLARARLSNMARLFIGWFGPRGLNSLLLVLLAVEANVPGAEYLMAVTGVVVLVSVIAHGASATPLSAWYGRKVAAAQQTFPEEREATATGLFEPDPADVARITPQELAVLLSGPEPPVVLDVRSRAHYEGDDSQIPGSVRVLPDQIETWMAAPRDRLVVAYCT